MLLNSFLVTDGFLELLKIILTYLYMYEKRKL